MKNIFATTFLSILLFFIVTVKAEAENPVVSGTISGKVVDASSGEPMPYVNVVVRDLQDSIITGGITDEEGEFNIAGIPVGRSNVEIQFMGYETIEKKIQISQESRAVEFSTVQLTEDSQQLEEVTVRGEVSTVTQKIDHKVINVGKDLTATGTNASELLNHVQSVSVDQQTGEVSLRGNENVRIFVDGKPSTVSPAQLLKQIPSSSIKSIELITNPSAKYSPEGMSGIINIVLYKNANRGFNGSADAGVTAGKNMRYNGAADLNFSRGKINVYANYGGDFGKSEGGGSLQLLDRNIHTEASNLRERSSHLVKTGLDLFIDEKNTLSVYTTQNLYDQFRTVNTEIFYNNVSGSDNIQYLDRESYSGAYNMNYRHSFNENNHYIEFEGTYSATNRMELGTYTDQMNVEDPTSNYMDDAMHDLTNTLFNLDYTKNFTGQGKLEAGLEYRFDGTRNNYITDRHRYVLDEM
ncbi:MAG: TonB-dependent receptor [Bacteroidales bacterium]|nr:TonB-dependent receptor [Bacteroidales bacterium]MDT8432680.1 TonB-dependent receptor [Bacteroidales bacterium]